MGALVGFFSDYQHNKWLNQLLSGVSYTPPTTLYIGLHTTKASRLAQIEVKTTGTGYSRTAIPTGAFDAAVRGITQNNVSITLPAPTGDWGTINSIGIYDAATAGNLLAVIATSVPKLISDGDDATVIPAGSLAILRS